MYSPMILNQLYHIPILVSRMSELAFTLLPIHWENLGTLIVRESILGCKLLLENESRLLFLAGYIAYFD